MFLTTIFGFSWQVSGIDEAVAKGNSVIEGYKKFLADVNLAK